MFVRLKNDEGFVQLVNLGQAQKIVPIQYKDKSMGIKVIWQHDTFRDHGENDIPDDTCDYSEDNFVDVTVQEVEELLKNLGLVVTLKSQLPPRVQTPNPNTLEESNQSGTTEIVIPSSEVESTDSSKSSEDSNDSTKNESSNDSGSKKGSESDTSKNPRSKKNQERVDLVDDKTDSKNTKE